MCFAVKHLHVPEDIPEGRSRNEIVQFPSLLKLIPVTQRGRLELGVAKTCFQADVPVV